MPPIELAANRLHAKRCRNEGGLWILPRAIAFAAHVRREIHFLRQAVLPRISITGTHMASRKQIPAEVQKEVLLKSRRRCCLCFWLEGIDEVVRGQIAHLDHDASNNALDNLAFLCFDHHDEYDSTPNVSKGLQRPEVIQWRDALYEELEYRFRSVRARKAELTITRFEMVDTRATFRLAFRLRNVGEATLANATLSIRLPANVSAESPRKSPKSNCIKGPFGGVVELGIDFSTYSLPDMFGFTEATEDFFEPGGRVARYATRPRSGGLLPDHSLEFTGL
jgi:hypothetical protein